MPVQKQFVVFNIIITFLKVSRKRFLQKSTIFGINKGNLYNTIVICEVILWKKYHKIRKLRMSRFYIQDVLIRSIEGYNAC
jgi:hypothetical protein